jgi:hypothetical protein
VPDTEQVLESPYAKGNLEAHCSPIQRAARGLAVVAVQLAKLAAGPAHSSAAGWALQGQARALQGARLATLYHAFCGAALAVLAVLAAISPFATMGAAVESACFTGIATILA